MHAPSSSPVRPANARVALILACVAAAFFFAMIVNHLPP